MPGDFRLYILKSHFKFCYSQQMDVWHTIFKYCAVLKVTFAIRQNNFNVGWVARNFVVCRNISKILYKPLKLLLVN